MGCIVLYPGGLNETRKIAPFLFSCLSDSGIPVVANAITYLIGSFFYILPL